MIVIAIIISIVTVSVSYYVNLKAYEKRYGDMRKVWKVTIYSMKDGRKDVYETECETKEQVARVFMSFKTKRGYEVMKFKVEREWWLV